MKTFMISVVLLLLVGNLQAEEYYRSIDTKGSIHYGDTPPQDAEDVEKLRAQTAPEVDATLPYETRRAQAKFPVSLYTGDGCGDGCVQARDYLNHRGIPFTEHSLATAEEIAAYKQATGGLRIPALQIGADWLVTFIEGKWGQALDAAGYPKTAPYGFHPSVKQAPSEKATSE